MAHLGNRIVRQLMRKGLGNAAVLGPERYRSRQSGSRADDSVPGGPGCDGTGRVEVVRSQLEAQVAVAPAMLPGTDCADFAREIVEGAASEIESALRSPVAATGRRLSGSVGGEKGVSGGCGNSGPNRSCHRVTLSAFVSASSAARAVAAAVLARL